MTTAILAQPRIHGNTKQLDEHDESIVSVRAAALDKLTGPRVGDFAILLDGRTMRFSHDWGKDIQVSAGGSFYLGDGYVSFSGGLEPAIMKDRFSLVDEPKLGSFWIFHHDEQRAHNGIDLNIPCRVFKQEIYSMTHPEHSQRATAADDAFDRAIDTGRLSADPKAPNYAGHYMYMGHGKTGDMFKHIDTREYI